MSNDIKDKIQEAKRIASTYGAEVDLTQLEHEPITDTYLAVVKAILKEGYVWNANCTSELVTDVFYYFQPDDALSAMDKLIDDMSKGVQRTL